MDGKLIYLLYRALQWAGSPLILLYFLFRILQDGRYFRGLDQRLGFLPHQYKQTAPGAIWLHAVSVGEILTSVQLLRRLRERLPLAPLYVSTTTLAGMSLAQEKLREFADGVFYAPIDYCFAVRRLLRTIRPSVVIVAETEIWPNLYREAKRIGCGLLIVNGRISDRAAPRYSRLVPFFRPVLALPDVILAQSEISRRRYIALGAPPEKVALGGNLKYDFEPRATGVPDAISRLLSDVRPGRIWIAASTMPPAEPGDPDEDDVVIDAFQRLATTYSDLLLILVPRKPERFDDAARKLAEANVPFVRRSALGEGTTLPRLPGVLLVDSVGELGGLFSAADVVFMGGTFPKRGGHNVLEPAFFARPVIVGPHMENFPEVAAEFSEGNAWLRVEDPADLAAAVLKLLGDDSLREQIGARARRLAEGRRGATARALREIESLYARSLARYRPAVLAFQVRWLLSKLWAVGGRWNRRRDTARAQRLSTPVVSVGGLTVGGAGKTPFVLWLAARLKDAGIAPAILTRGYRRRAPEKHTILEAGASVPPARTGDEAQIFLRSGLAPVGIGASRALTGRMIEERFHPNVMLLDDGFQHWRLQRSIDIVLVDALDPFGGGELFPLGRLREPPEALERADAFVLTRAERGRPLDGIEAALAKHNPGAPVFHSRVAPECWLDCASGNQWPARGLPFSRVLAFCGLANPAAFWQTLSLLGCRPAGWETFRDHHHYRPVEILRLAGRARAAGAEALLTTEKDIMNLPGGAAGWVAPLPLCWLKIGLEVDEPEELLRFIQQRLSAPPRT